jgi:DNA topoisomerase-2
MDLIYKKLNLIKKVNIKNMNLYDKYGRIKKYKTTSDIINDFYYMRLSKYFERKKILLDDIIYKINIFKYKKIFIKYYIEGIIEINKRK